METRRLEYFAVLTSEQHFGKAAARLHISQSALSQQIQRLETDLGAQLIDRAVSGFALTPAGERVLRQSRVVLEGMDQLKGLSADAQAGRFGRLRVAVPHSILYSQVPTAVHRYGHEHPAVEIEIRLDRTPEIHDMIRLAQVEVGFSYTAPASSELAVREMYRDPYVVVLPNAHPLGSATAVTLDQLKDERLLLSPRRNAPEAYDAIIGACIDRGFSAHDFTVDMTSYIDQVGLVAAGMGISLLPERLQQRVRYPGVRMVPLVGSGLESRLLASWNPSVANPARDAFVALATEMLGAPLKG